MTTEAIHAFFFMSDGPIALSVFRLFYKALCPFHYYLSELRNAD